MQDANQMCVLCDEAITNPICLQCLGQSMEQWAVMEKPVILKELNSRIELFKSYTHDGTKCVVCKKNINICSHCFSKDIYNWLIDNHPETVSSFLVGFNYELEGPCRF